MPTTQPPDRDAWSAAVLAQFIHGFACNEADAMGIIQAHPACLEQAFQHGLDPAAVIRVWNAMTVHQATGLEPNTGPLLVLETLVEPPTDGAGVPRFAVIPTAQLMRHADQLKNSALEADAGHGTRFELILKDKAWPWEGASDHQSVALHGGSVQLSAGYCDPGSVDEQEMDLETEPLPLAMLACFSRLADNAVVYWGSKAGRSSVLDAFVHEQHQQEAAWRAAQQMSIASIGIFDWVKSNHCWRRPKSDPLVRELPNQI